MNKLIEQISQLKYLAIREHYYCEDSWFSCPKAEDGSANYHNKENECNCGADEHNNEVQNIWNSLRNIT